MDVPPPSEGFDPIQEKKPFFLQVLRANKIFEWKPKYEEVFYSLKNHLRNLSSLTKTVPGDALYLYFSIIPMTVRSVLAKEETKGHVPVYYVSNNFIKFETNYLEIEKHIYMRCSSKLERFAHIFMHLTSLTSPINI